MIINTYKELEEYVSMFAKGGCELLVIESRGGYGKSFLTETVMRQTNKPYLPIGTHVTPLKLYKLVYDYRDMAIVIDDCESLMMDRHNIALIRNLAETREFKTVSWHTTSKMLEEDIPQTFRTKSRVLILTNDLQLVSKKIGKAMLSRGFFIKFEPKTSELLNKMEEIIDSIKIDLPNEDRQLVFELIKKWAKYSNDISLRTLVKGLQLKKEFSKTWETKLINVLEIKKELTWIHSLQEDYATDLERLEIWDKTYGLSRATYYNYKKSLEI